MSLPLSYHSADARGCTHQLFLRGILSHGWCRVLVTPFAIFLLLPPLARAQFATVIDIPAGTSLPPQSSIDSNTQLNLFDGGSIGAGFSAGAIDGSSANVEVNLLGGVVGGGFNAYRGSVVNVSGGTIGDPFSAHDGAGLNISGGTVKSITATGSAVVVSGGAIEDIGLKDASELTLTGGAVRILNVSNSTAHVTNGPSGGFGVYNGKLTITGGSMAGSTVYNGGVIEIANASLNGYLRLNRGSSAFLYDGATIRNASAFDRSTLNIYDNAHAGLGSSFFSAQLSSTIRVYGGVVGGRYASNGHYTTAGSLDVGSGSSLEILGGTIGSETRVSDNGLLEMSGGRALSVNVGARGVAKLAGGSIDSLRVDPNGVARMDGGMIGALDLYGGRLDLHGGSIASHLYAWTRCEVRIHATQFALDGVDITAQLLGGEPLTISERNVTLTGTYRDGSPFEILLSDSAFGVSKYAFKPQVTISLALVPELRSVSLLIISCAIFGLNSRRPRH